MFIGLIIFIICLLLLIFSRMLAIKKLGPITGLLFGIFYMIGFSTDSHYSTGFALACLFTFLFLILAILFFFIFRRKNVAWKKIFLFIVTSFVLMIFFFTMSPSKETTKTTATETKIDATKINQSTSNNKSKATEVKTKKDEKPKQKAIKASLPSGLVNATISKNTDGDTVHVNINGNDEIIRMLLIDTPETVDPRKPVEPYGKEASNYAKEMLPVGTKVKLQEGVKGSERDKYNRLLAFIYLPNGKMYNEEVVKKGYARVAYIYPPNTQHLDALRKDEATAKKKKLGIWSINGYVTSNGYNVSDKKKVTTVSSTKPSSSSLLNKSSENSKVATKSSSSSSTSSSSSKRSTTKSNTNKSNSDTHKVATTSGSGSSTSSGSSKRSTTKPNTGSNTNKSSDTHKVATTSSSSSSTSSSSSHKPFENDPSDDKQSNMGCVNKIKGNANSKIYHVPGGAYYNKTVDNIVWFCSEADARAAGYRASKR